ncbi:hypothetical protein FA13DRAFT_1640082 [Coprinellus micaceus]|uniref:Uncharacterized protein n=1 Tax=Coprinellus micaceus TaxID=71717 RepID=A0A4Y7SPZ1_COPMI|nr:hypothetical protein FA13DRAFT_1640082 [Coprinellus micaceus]
MVFLVPSQFDTFVPPPAGPGQRAPEESPTRPWNGDLVVAGLRPSDRTLSERIHVSAIETDGENRLDSWPNEFALDILYTGSERDIRREMSHWVSQTGQPSVNFMPAPLRGSNQRDMNITLFRLLSKVLMDNRTVAIAQWRTGELAYQGSGVIVYPAPNSSAYLIGAVFHSTDFPDFIRSALTPTVTIPAAPGVSISGSYQPHVGHSSPYSAHAPQSHYRNQQQSSSPHHSGPSSPIEHPGGNYRYIVPMPSRTPGQYPNQPSGSGANSGGHYGAGYPSGNPPPLP